MLGLVALLLVLPLFEGSFLVPFLESMTLSATDICDGLYFNELFNSFDDPDLRITIPYPAALYRSGILTAAAF